MSENVGRKVDLIYTQYVFLNTRNNLFWKFQFLCSIWQTTNCNSLFYFVKESVFWLKNYYKKLRFVFRNSNWLLKFLKLFSKGSMFSNLFLIFCSNRRFNCFKNRSDTVPKKIALFDLKIFCKLLAFFLIGLVFYWYILCVTKGFD